MKTLSGKVVALTGAASGVGRSLAIQLSKAGCKLALCDVNEEELIKTVELIADNNEVSTYIVDVAIL